MFDGGTPATRAAMWAAISAGESEDGRSRQSRDDVRQDCLCGPRVRSTDGSLRGSDATPARVAGDLERADDPLDGGNTFPDGLGLFFLLFRFHRPAEVDRPLAANDAEMSQICVVFCDQTRFHL